MIEEKEIMFVFSSRKWVCWFGYGGFNDFSLSLDPSNLTWVRWGRNLPSSDPVLVKKWNQLRNSPIVRTGKSCWLSSIEFLPAPFGRTECEMG